MKKPIAALLLLLLILVGQTAGAESERPSVYYFFENYCASCQPEDEFRESFRALTGQSMDGYAYYYYNTVESSGAAALNDAIVQFAIPEDQQKLPLAIIDGQIYGGTTAIRTALPAKFLEETESTDSLIYSLYVTACESCADAKIVLNQLPETVEVHRGEIAFPSRVVVREVDIGSELSVAQALFEHYGVPESERLAPIVFLGDRYYQGADRIAQRLSTAVQGGYAVGTPLIDGGEADLSALSFAGSVTAGFVGGLNPCALSMLLFFLTLLISSKKNAAFYAALFLVSKFAAYLLIGTLFMRLFQSWNPVWLKAAVRWIMTGVGGALVIANLWDAIRAKREAYGDVKNQLPSGMRRFLHHRIRAALEGQSKWLSPIVVALGFVVAGGEFLCAGQIYLATLLTAVQSGAQGARTFGMLISYCAAFILPASILSVAVLRGKAMFTLSEWLRARMSLIKIITAAVLIGLIALVWLI